MASLNQKRSALLYLEMAENISFCGSFLSHCISLYPLQTTYLHQNKCFRHLSICSIPVPSPTHPPHPKKKKKELAGAKALYATSTERWEFVYLHQVEHSVFKALKCGLRLLSDDCVYTGLLPVGTLRIFESVAWFAFREGKGSACDKVLQRLWSVLSGTGSLHLFQSQNCYFSPEDERL